MRICSTLIAMAVAAVVAVVAVPTTADASCHCMMPHERTDADEVATDIFSDATQVVIMREGTQTVLSLRNRYDGPTEEFAMVLPVPMVLEPDNVKTLQDDIFDRVDTLTAPRLVEYFEEDPCPDTGGGGFDFPFTMADEVGSAEDQGGWEDVSVEAEFKEGEYEITILGAEESTALEDWLVEHDYSIPEGAAPFLEPYIQDGMYFFVAEVDPDEVEFRDGEAILSPLRFHYDTEEFLLPVRLGMINSRGEQDLIVNVLAQNQRYELANYDNVTIPTNLEVSEDVQNNFGSFYRTLFSNTARKHPTAAITEYAMSAGDCDPCPEQMPRGMHPEDLEILGAETLPDLGHDAWGNPDDWVITRLHLRYQRDQIGEDLVFRKADPIAGGREVFDDDGNLEEGAQPAAINAFQARYVIRHAWDGDVDCRNPEFNNWRRAFAHQAQGPNTTGDEVFGGESVDLGSTILGVSSHDRSAEADWEPSGCSAAGSERAPAGPLAVFMVALALMVVFRKNRTRD